MEGAVGSWLTLVSSLAAKPASLKTGHYTTLALAGYRLPFRPLVQWCTRHNLRPGSIFQPRCCPFYTDQPKGGFSMKAFALAATLCLAFTCAAKDHDDYQKGTLTRMDSKACGSQENGGKTVAGEILGTDSQHRKTQELLCQEYVLESDRIVYHIRPKDDKHPALLPIGETAQFRVHKDKLILRVPEADGKEREYIVVSMTPREKTETPAQSASKN